MGSMGDSLSGSLSGDREKPLDPLLSAASSQTIPHSEEPLAVLHRNLSDGLQPPAAILHAAAETARAITGADGVALAVRTKGLIVCRACSGDPTPDLGTPLDEYSGISGECLRTDSILVCDDAQSDSRVDPDVCRYLGIRSIAAVPLHGPTGVAGILETFSTRVKAFRQHEIDSLRELATIAEAAYGREIRGLQEAPSQPARPMRIRMLSEESVNSQKQSVGGTSDGTSIVRRLWFIGTAVLAMLLIAGVWLSGHEPVPETSAKEPSRVEARGPTTELPATSTVTSQPKPRAGITRPEPSAAGVLTNAAQIEVIEDKPAQSITPGSEARSAAAETSSTTVPSTADTADSSPPVVASRSTGAESAGGSPIAKLAAAPSAFPTLGAAVSQGLMPGVLMHKVEPVYPAQAKAQHISGTVALQVTIAEDGHIRDVKEISGEPALAAAARDAIRRWRYSPFLLNGKPVEVEKEISVVFKLL